MSTQGAGSTRAASSRPAEQCIALIDYDALNADEISFRAGDVINVTGKGTASGFWEGYVALPTRRPVSAAAAEADGEGEQETASLSAQPPVAPRGLFPNCLVTSNMRFKTTLANYAFQNVALCLYAYAAREGGGEMSFDAGDVIAATRPSASPGWWYGVKSTGPAWTAPPPPPLATRFADPSPSPPPATTTAAASAAAVSSSGDGAAEGRELLFPTNFVTCDVVRISFNFTGRQLHELSCRSGDVVQVHRRWNDGWWEGTLRGRRGIFPSNYSVPNICTTSPPLFCPRCRTVFASNAFEASCATCAAEATVEDVMLQSLDAYARGEVAEFDLFANVDIGSLAEEKDAGQRSGGGGTSSAKGEEGPSAVHGESGRHLRIQGPGGRDDAARVRLLTEKDLADLASNRVKLIE